MTPNKPVSIYFDVCAAIDIYQNCLALNYLLTLEGGVCGKFNLSNCYLQIDDEGKVMEENTNHMKTLAHVPAHTWKGWSPSDLFGGWFSTLGGFKTLIGTTFLVLRACLISPCESPWYCRLSGPLWKPL
jgi:hypothetical protein